MADAIVFDWVCDEIEARSSLDRLEARGTLRIALRSAGLEARTVTPEQMRVVVGEVLPLELEHRAVDDAAEVCRNLSTQLARRRFDEVSAETPETVFKRLAS